MHLYTSQSKIPIQLCTCVYNELGNNSWLVVFEPVNPILNSQYHNRNYQCTSFKEKAPKMSSHIEAKWGRGTNHLLSTSQPSTEFHCSWQNLTKLNAVVDAQLYLPLYRSNNNIFELALLEGLPIKPTSS